MAIRMTKVYMAISPTMNDQWSGKILSMAERNQLDEPRRSSTQSNACCCCRARLRAAERSATVLMAVYPCAPVPLWNGAATTRHFSYPPCSRNLGRSAL